MHPRSTPLEPDLGYYPRSPCSILLEDAPAIKTVEEFIDDLEALQRQAIEFLEHARQNQAKDVNEDRLRHKFMNVVDPVMLSTQYIQRAFMHTTNSRNLRAKCLGPSMITKRVSFTSYELDLPANFRVYPVINLEYLEEFHPSPERFVGRPVESRNRRLNDEEIVDSNDIGSVPDHREGCTGRLQYLCQLSSSAYSRPQ
jgi:hypothetical protein